MISKLFKNIRKKENNKFKKSKGKDKNYKQKLNKINRR